MAYGKARVDQLQSSTRTINTDDILTTAAGSVTSTQIADGTITNADINASAAIADTKLATISTAGKVNGTALTGSIPGAVLSNSQTFVGTTAVNLNRTSANQGLTGISSVALPGATSGTITVTPAAVAGTTAITVPATSGTLVTTGDTGSVTSTMIADNTIVNGDINPSAAIDGSKINPNFGSQNTTTTGTSTAASFIPSSSTAPTNGVYLPAVNSVGIATNGTGKLTIDASGNITIATGGNILADLSNATLTSRTYFQTSTANSSSVVGVLPNGTSTTSAYYAFNNSTPTNASLAAVTIDSTSSYVQSTKVGTGTYLPLKFVTSGVSQMTLDTSGNLTFNNGQNILADFSNGTLTNRTYFQTSTANVGTTVGALPNGTSTGSAFYAFNNSTPTNASYCGATIDASAAYIVSNVTGAGTYLPLIFKTNNANRMWLDTSGNVGIGRTPTVDLDVYRASGDARIVVDSDSLADLNSASFYAYGGARNAAIGVYKHSGITNPCAFAELVTEGSLSHKLWVDNTATLGQLRISTNSAHIGTTSGTVVGTQTSDERIKNILGPVEYGLDTLKQIEPVRFSIKGSEETEKLGFIAQQVLPLVPESVFDTDLPIEGEPKDAPTMLGMEYVSLIPVLVNAVKELAEQNAALESRLAALEAA